MTIRTFQPGDEAAQISIYNEAATALPRFKPATLDEVRRRSRAADFEPGLRFFAVEKGQAVGYAAANVNGRLSVPWCRPGHEGQAEPLFQAALEALRARGLRKAFAAYRADWPAQRQFFLEHGFRQARDMINFVVDLVELPTPAARPSSAITPLRADDLPGLFNLAPAALRSATAEELGRHLLHNPYFPADAAFVLRSRATGAPLAAGLVVENPAYANPTQVDPGMPCFRLGTFGTEGMQTKRINGLFSFLIGPGNHVSPVGLDLLSYTLLRLGRTNVETLAAQVSSDAAHLVRFYQQYFKRQASFPVFERDL